MDRGAWWATVHGVAKSQTRRSDFTMDTLSLTKEARIYNGEKKISLTSDAHLSDLTSVMLILSDACLQ